MTGGLFRADGQHRLTRSGLPADPTAILATQPIVENAEVARLVSGGDYKTTSRQMSLRGVSEAFMIYEIREREPAAAEA